jgi:predicted protein tyrosine phosphatase
MIHKTLASITTDRIIAIVGLEEIVDVEVTDKEHAVLISITEPGAGQVISDDVRDRYKSVLDVQFWDILKPTKTTPIISDETARKIRRFILNNRDKRFAFHCHAGISRSAACAQAMECLLDFDGDIYAYQTSNKSEITKYWRYHPNHTVFLKVVGEDVMPANSMFTKDFL